MRPVSVLVLFALSACGSESSEAVPPTAVEMPEALAEAEEAATETTSTAYELHEWGLLDVAEGHFELAAGPGDPQAAPTRPTPNPAPSPMVRPPSPMRPAPRRKPVVYIHADAPVEFRLEVHTSGPVAEHWPPTSIEGQTIRWQVAAQPGACTSGAYPSAASPQCVNAPDGYCELADLPGYETSDGACLTVNGQTWDHLFYRSGGAAPPLPIRVTSEGTGVLIENISLATPHGGIYRFSRGASETLVQRVEMPPVGGSVIMERGLTSPEVRAELSGLLRSGGLTEPEAQAFEGAWFDELFDMGSTGGAPVVTDAIIYILPEAHLDPVSRLVATPAPMQTRRMFWVRVSLN